MGCQAHETDPPRTDQSGVTECKSGVLDGNMRVHAGLGTYSTLPGSEQLDAIVFEGAAVCKFALLFPILCIPGQVLGAGSKHSNTVNAAGLASLDAYM